MTESGKRVIVDGVDLQRVFRFPRMLGAVTAAMQPGRLLIALFMVVLLLALGRLWDRVTRPSVHPLGLTAGRADFASDSEHQAVLRDAVLAYTLGMNRADIATPGQDQGWYRPNEVVSWVHDRYVIERGSASTEDDRRRLDEQYRLVMSQINQTRPLGDFEATLAHVSSSFREMLRGVYHLNVDETLEGGRRLFAETPIALWRYQTWFAILYGLAFLVIGAIGGGAISRMAAVFAATESRLSINEAVDFAFGRAWGLVWAKALPLVILGVLAGIVALLGALMHVPVLDIVMGLFYGLILLLGFLMAFLILGYAVGFPLLVPAVAVENGDGADAMHRAYAYVVNRPLHALWYWLVGLLGMLLGFAIVAVVALLTLNFTGLMFATLAPASTALATGGYDAFGFTRSDVVVTGAWHERWAGNIMLIWQALVVCLVVAYVVSYFFSAGTRAYLLMRKASDGQEMDEIWKPGLIPGTLAPEPPAMAVAGAENDAA